MDLPSILILSGGGLAIFGGLLAVALAVKIARMKLDKEIGLWKRHRQFHPPRPVKHYVIRDP